MEKIMEFARVGNASSLAYNWIYNPAYLKQVQASHTLLFQPLDPEDFVKSEKSFLAYPDMKVGDLSAQGDIMMWLYDALKDNPDLTAKEYQDLVFDKIKPGGAYVGYVESYGRALVFNKIAKLHKLDVTPIPMDDDQMIGFAPYVAAKALGLGNERAFELASAFTNREDFKVFYQAFDTLLDLLKSRSMVQAIQSTILTDIPVQDRFQKALLQDTDTFITETVNTACHVYDAVPLVFHILYRTQSFTEALELNAQIGGASSDRGTLIGALYHTTGSIPKNVPKI